MSLDERMHLRWPQLAPARAISREAELDKVIAAERSIAYVRLGVIAFGVFILLAMSEPTDPLVAWFVLFAGGIYSLWVLTAQPYRQNPILMSRPFTTLTDGVLILLWLYSNGGLASNTFVLIYTAIISVAYRYGQRETIIATVGYTLGYLALGVWLGQVSAYQSDLVVRMVYFLFVGFLSARFSGEALDQLQAKLDLRDLARSLEIESTERQRAEQALARYAESLETRIAERTQELRRAKDQLESILNSTSDGIVFARPDGQIEHVNTAFCRLFGCDEGDALGHKLDAFVAPQDAARLTEAIMSAPQAPARVLVDVACARRDESVWQAEFAITPVLSPDNGGVICSLRDITERKQMEEQLRATVTQQRELNAMKTRFIAMVSHEYRTPLASILMAVDLLARNYDKFQPDERAQIVERIRQNIKRLTAMLDDVLTFGRTETERAALTLSEVDLQRLCREAIAEVGTTMDREDDLRYAMDGTPQPLLLDEQLTRQMLTNVLSNAVKYSPSGSPVDLRVCYTSASVTVTVSDRGIGIPQSDQARLFEAFHRASNVGTTPGTGLGMAIVKHAVDLHQGTIEVTSAVNAGTQVTITLPVQPSAGGEAEA